MVEVRLSVMILMLLSTAKALGTDDPRATADPGTFVEKATQEGLTEVRLSEIARKASPSAAVRDFAERMIRDHRKIDTELADVARSKQLKVPTTFDAEHQAVVEELMNVPRAAFDARYTQRMAIDHSTAMDLFTQATQSLDHELAAFSKRQLPLLEEHKRMADALARSTSSEGPKAATGTHKD
jgi:putative membrane protein